MKLTIGSMEFEGTLDEFIQVVTFLRKTNDTGRNTNPIIEHADGVVDEHRTTDNTECNTNPIIERVEHWADKEGTDFTGVVIDDHETIAYFLNGKLHRNGNKWCGPAIQYYDGDKEWHMNGKCHRIGGPACEYADGYKVWYYDGELISNDQKYTLEDFHNTLKAKGIKI